MSTNFTMRQPAFTLVELMVTLALVGIVLSMGMLVVSVFGQLHHRFEDQVDHTYTLVQIRQRLQQDLLRTAQVKYGLQEMVLLDAQDHIVVRYTCLDSQLIRRTPQLSDTLAGKWQWTSVQDPALIHWRHFPSHLPLVLRLPYTANLRNP